MSDQQAIRPSAWYYALSALVVVSALCLFVYTLSYGTLHIADNLIQVVVPGAMDVNLQPKLRYTIFLEWKSVVEGRVYSTKRDVKGLTCTVTSQATGRQVDTRRSTGTTYTVNGRSGRSILEFMTAEAGAYHVACSYEEGMHGPVVVLAIGSGVEKGILGILAKCFASFFGGWFLGGAIFLTVFIKRERAKKRMAQTAMASHS